ncbi:PHD finger family protein [Perilla frutescens var. hirtella]|nr:PHD finger family protein [Perilla frutescens var. hirtella]
MGMQVGRSLFCLGLLIRYGSSLLDASASNPRNIDVASSIDLFKKYLQAEDFIIKVRALQALGYALIARPECMLQKDVGKILEATLSANADYRLKMQSLQNMFEYLLDAESRMEPDKASNDNNSQSADGTSVPVATGAGDTNICGGIVQLYWTGILGRSLDANKHVHQAALKIVEIVLRQGLVHPITCVPYLIALETDPEEVNAKLSHHLLMNMNEKYPAFCESRLGDGLQLSFIFICTMSGGPPEMSNNKSQAKLFNNIKGKADMGSSTIARHGVARIYKLICGNRISRNRFMSSVVHKFETPTWSDSVIPFLMAGTLESNIKDFSNLLQINAHKSYGNGMVEDKTINHGSERTMGIDGSQTPAGELHDQHLYGEDLNKDPNTNLMTSRDPYSISASDLQKIQAALWISQVDFLAAGAMQLLLKLKRQLKIVYGLDDVRCQAFSPNEPVKPGETLLRQSIPFNISDVNIDPPNTYGDIR